VSNPFTPVLVDLSHLLGGAAVAIVLITVLIRLALHPLTRIAVRGERARTRLAPQVAELRKRHGRDLTRLGEEMTALYRAEKISPFAGIGPMLLQAPIFLVLYRATAYGRLGTARLFGVPLSTRFVTSAPSPGVHLAVFALLFATLAAIATFTSRRAAALTKTLPKTLPKAAGEAAGEAAGDVAGGLMSTVSRVAPFFVLVSAAVLPLAAGVYLVTTTAWTAAENALLRRGLPARN
jgi:YidC/Oxa1 family membrane protein insertase